MSSCEHSATSLLSASVFISIESSPLYIWQTTGLSTMQLYSVCSRFTICGDACPLSCISAEACLTGWPNAWVGRGGKFVNAALLSLINEAYMNVCCAIPSSRVNSSAPLVCRHDRVTLEAGRVGLMGRDRGRRGYWVTLYLFIYTARLLLSSVSLGV